MNVVSQGLWVMDVIRAALRMAAPLVLLSIGSAALAIDDYKLGPDSQVRETIPHGKVTKHSWNTSKIFPGTVRDYYVYIPQQYQPGKPACVMVFQDGSAYVDVGPKSRVRVPVVFDNLIHDGDMPVTIGVFVNPGVIPATQKGQQSRNNRSFEYDSLGDQYARLIVEEILPHVAQEQHVEFTTDPRGRAICGMSSGGICAFTAAWEHPEQFGKVLSHIGSFTNIRGGHVYPALIRKTERKPIKVYLQDGSNDLDNVHGNWPLANQEMAAALKFAKYDSHFEYGDGRHSAIHAGALLPESLRWLWKDLAPKPAAATHAPLPPAAK